MRAKKFNSTPDIPIQKLFRKTIVHPHAATISAYVATYQLPSWFESEEFLNIVRLSENGMICK